MSLLKIALDILRQVQKTDSWPGVLAEESSMVCSQIRQGEVGHWSGISRPFTGAGRGQTGQFHSACDLVAISVGGTLSNIILHPLSTVFEISVSSYQLFSILLQLGTLQLAIYLKPANAFLMKPFGAHS